MISSALEHQPKVSLLTLCREAAAEAVSKLEGVQRYAVLKKKMLEAAEEAIRARKEQAIEEVRMWHGT